MNVTVFGQPAGLSPAEIGRKIAQQVIYPSPLDRRPLIPGDAVAEELHCAAAPRHRWRIGRYQIEYDAGKWGLNDGCKGVANCKSLIRAWFALRRWQRTPSRPVE
jgi:hypothetical protein